MGEKQQGGTRGVSRRRVGVRARKNGLRPSPTVCITHSPSLATSAGGAGAGAALTMAAASLGAIFCEPVVVALSVILLSALPSTRFCHCWRVSSMTWMANACCGADKRARGQACEGGEVDRGKEDVTGPPGSARFRRQGVGDSPPAHASFKAAAARNAPCPWPRRQRQTCSRACRRGSCRCGTTPRWRRGSRA